MARRTDSQQVTFSAASAPSTRRRGAELERALLEAAIAELSDSGYSGLTFEAVAKRASTSRAVLYRRWGTKADLVKAALGYARDREPIDLPDTGSLRGDLIEVMDRISKARSGVGSLVLLQLSAYFLETGTGPADLREVFLASGEPNSFQRLYERASRRGEIELGVLPQRVKDLPMDLLRQEMLMTLQPVSRVVIEGIVDDVVLPLLALTGQGSDPAS